MAKLIYTVTDEAPMLASHSLLPILEAYGVKAGVDIEAWDISLAARILSHFPEALKPGETVPDRLEDLRSLVQSPEANIVKLPNVSSGVPQLKQAIAELQSQGYALPDYPDTPDSPEDRDAEARYALVLGSAVNPVLRQGNSDRQAPASVKAYAKAHPHWMGEWSSDSRTRVATMQSGDFFHNEKSLTLTEADTLRIEHVSDGGTITTLLASLPVEAGEILDATVMDVAKLSAFFAEQVEAARREKLLFSLHLKATMMKVSDPLIFGEALRVLLPRTFADFGLDLDAAGFAPSEGLAVLLDLIARLSREDIADAVKQDLANGPSLAMVNSDQGITGLHVPSHTIVDASMPAMIRNSGKMWDRDGKAQDSLAVLPDSTYAHIYTAVLADCRRNGAIDPASAGSVSNVGLMAQAAEEYGSHDKTFVSPGPGCIRIVNSAGHKVLEHSVQAGDIWRACQTKDAPIRSWVKLAVDRARQSDTPAVFWLDDNRAHDRQVMRKVKAYLEDEDLTGLDITIAAPVAAIVEALSRLRAGLDTISVTGNVLRDYNTDLFPILELGTSAKMLSIVPLMSGGGLFETGAGGTAPILAKQLYRENFLGWDSLGELLALVPSLQAYSKASGDARSALLASALDRATGTLLARDETPTRPGGGMDTRESHFLLALYWADEVASQDEDLALAADFRGLSEALALNSAAILDELCGDRGPVDLGGYFKPDSARTAAVMRPSKTFNGILESFATR